MCQNTVLKFHRFKNSKLASIATTQATGCVSPFSSDRVLMLGSWAQSAFQSMCFPSKKGKIPFLPLFSKNANKTLVPLLIFRQILWNWHSTGLIIIKAEGRCSWRFHQNWTWQFTQFALLLVRISCAPPGHHQVWFSFSIRTFVDSSCSFVHSRWIREGTTPKKMFLTESQFFPNVVALMERKWPFRLGTCQTQISWRSGRRTSHAEGKFQWTFSRNMCMQPVSRVKFHKNVTRTVPSKKSLSNHESNFSYTIYRDCMLEGAGSCVISPFPFEGIRSCLLEKYVGTSKTNFPSPIWMGKSCRFCVVSYGHQIAKMYCLPRHIL